MLQPWYTFTEKVIPMSTTKSNMINYPYGLSALASKRLPLLQAEHQVTWETMAQSRSAAHLEQYIKDDLGRKIARYTSEHIPVIVSEEHDVIRYRAQAVICNRHEMLEILYEAYRLGFSDATTHIPPAFNVPDGP